MLSLPAQHLLILAGFFHKTSGGGGDLLSGTIFGFLLGTASDGEGEQKLEKLFTEAKNAPQQQNYSKFCCFKVVLVAKSMI